MTKDPREKPSKADTECFPVVEEMLERFALVYVGRDMLVFDCQTFELRKPSAVKLEYAKRGIPIVKRNSPTIENPFNIWLTHPRRKTYDGMIFDPSGSVSPRFLNTYQGLPFAPMRGVVKPWLDHWWGICGERPEIADYCFRWMAHRVQRPWERPGTAIWLIGEQGIGKSLAAIDGFLLLFGAHGLHLTDPHVFEERFNAQLDRKVTVVADEAAFAVSGKIADKLKGIITEETLRIERKGVDPYFIKNCLGIIFITNRAEAFHASLDERRYLVIDADPRWKGDREYFKSFCEYLKRPESLPAILYHLKRVDLSGWNPMADLPRTEELLDQKLATLTRADPVARWLIDALARGQLRQYPEVKPWPDRPVEKDTVYDAFPDGEPKVGRRTFWKRLKALLGLRDEDLHARPGGRGSDRPRRVRLPGLHEARRRLEAHLQQAVPWDDLVADAERVAPPRRRRRSANVLALRRKAVGRRGAK